jgi:hypothetical protein
VAARRRSIHSPVTLPREPVSRLSSVKTENQHEAEADNLHAGDDRQPVHKLPQRVRFLLSTSFGYHVRKIRVLMFLVFS